MKVWEDNYGKVRRRGFRFDNDDIRIVVRGSEYDETEVCFDEEYETFCEEYEYRDIVKAFRDFAELVEKDWAFVELRIESKTDPELSIVFNRFYFIADFVVSVDDLCKDSEKLKEIAKKVEEIREILRS